MTNNLTETPIKILLVYPMYPDTFWGFKYALKFINKKATMPPLGLVTVASLLPKKWQKKLVDLNIGSLKTKDILWADYIFISAMSVQEKSVNEIIKKCKLLNKKIVAGGPLFTEEYENFPEVDYLVLNEAEITLPQFINDLNNGTAKKIYETSGFSNIAETPVPDFSLVKASKYAELNIQYSRGCPFNCEFCDVTALFGHRVRTKSTNQIILELENIYNSGWRGNVFFVDDNFIGKPKVLKNDLLPAMIKWMETKNYPFTFSTEASINLSDDTELMNMMIQAGFNSVFIGIETPDNASLSECGKTQNMNRDILNSVKKIQNQGMEVSAGFIVGFDHDSPSIFQRQINFIQESGIMTAMVGLLNAPKKTRLYNRLKNEGRILNEISGNNTDFSLNFIPKMNIQQLLNGYKEIIRNIYSSKPYYKRMLNLLKRFPTNYRNRQRITPSTIMSFLRTIFVIGIFNSHQKYYWLLFFWSLFNRPKLLPIAIKYSVYGYHFRKIFKDIL
ncbi:MAG: B12-binding domain-containing radical SAM protein [Bacteroidales bacterium]|nr:B12-binding domain-containing radical SAM protein [Bacteroidales bacterium]